MAIFIQFTSVTALICGTGTNSIKTATVLASSLSRPSPTLIGGYMSVDAALGRRKAQI